MGLEELQLLGKALAPLAGWAAVFIGLPYGAMKLSDYRDRRRATASQRIASIDWLDPDLRRN